MTFDEVRACRLLDGEGAPTMLHPPTLEEVYDALGSNALINIELKVFSGDCQTATTGPDALVAAVLEEVIAIGGQDRTLFSSFDATAVELVKSVRPGFYSALISSNPDDAFVDKALELQQDAIHPLFSISKETAQLAIEKGLQVNVWGVDDASSMQRQIDKGSTAIITNKPGVLSELVGEEP
jgi:glycerophosphoryl diester phosphodiesterase